MREENVLWTFLAKGQAAGQEFHNYFPSTLEGWLKGINMPMAGDPGGDGAGGFRTGTDAFTFALGYYEGDYRPINPNAVISDTRDKLWDNYKDIRDTTAAKGL